MKLHIAAALAVAALAGSAVTNLVDLPVGAALHATEVCTPPASVGAVSAAATCAAPAPIRMLSATTTTPGWWKPPAGAPATIPGLTVTATVTVPSTLDILATTFASVTACFAYTFLYVDGDRLTAAGGVPLYGGISNAAPPETQGGGVNSATVTVEPGTHTVEVRATNPCGGHGILSGHLRVVVVPL